MATVLDAGRYKGVLEEVNIRLIRGSQQATALEGGLGIVFSLRGIFRKNWSSVKGGGAGLLGVLAALVFSWDRLILSRADSKTSGALRRPGWSN